MVYPLQQYQENASGAVGVPHDPAHVLLHYNDTWKAMVRQRPFVKFRGCYITVVNYYSEGGRAKLPTDWKNPVRTVTYYRYLSFYPPARVRWRSRV